MGDDADTCVLLGDDHALFVEAMIAALPRRGGRIVGAGCGQVFPETAEKTHGVAFIVRG